MLSQHVLNHLILSRDFGRLNSTKYRYQVKSLFVFYTYISRSFTAITIIHVVSMTVLSQHIH